MNPIRDEKRTELNTLSRREWITSVAAGASALGVAACAQSPQAEKPSAAKLQTEVFDAHVHIWTPDTENYPLADGFTTDDFWIPSYTVEDLMAQARPAGVTRVNFVQMTWYGLDHKYILDVIASDPEHFVGTGIIPAIRDVALADQGDTMLALAKGGIYAFRVRGRGAQPPSCVVDSRWMDQPGYHTMFKTGGEHNLALSFLMPARDLPEVDRMCTEYPDTPVILDHFCLIGTGNRFDEDEIDALCRMARHHRVMVKMGAFYALGSKQPPYLDVLPLIRRVVDAFGPERCMWESDAPLNRWDTGHVFEDSVALVRDHADFLSVSDREQILTKTAENFFFNR